MLQPNFAKEPSSPFPLTYVMKNIATNLKESISKNKTASAQQPV